MPKHVVSAFIKQMLMKSIHVVGSKVLIFGLSFKENCPDIRNTKIVDVINELQEYNVDVDVYDPCVNADDALNEYGIAVLSEEPKKKYDGILLLVAHDEFKLLSADDLQILCKSKSVIYDLKYILDKSQSDVRL
jgi:UDP-N-acetyl-D-galactosamine dehydrogenase